MTLRLTLSIAASILSVAVAATDVLTQSQSAPSGPTFDVVSVKRHVTPAGAGPLEEFNSTVRQRPDGGLTMLNIPAMTFIARAYTSAPIDMVGLPEWARTERYDLEATASLVNPTAEQRAAMLRAVLVDRFKLAAHIENRDTPVYDLVVARNDKKLGASIKPSEVDCLAKAAADRAALEATGKPAPPPPGVFDPNAPPPPCSMRMTGDRMEGDATMENLARFLRSSAGRMVVDKTGLAGSYRVTLTFDRMAGLRGPQTGDPVPGAAPSVFTAVQEQLGLKLESSRAMLETLIIDRFERPTEN
jgi:uncharacterized protein (TIGR03435 family)